MIIVTAIIKS